VSTVRAEGFDLWFDFDAGPEGVDEADQAIEGETRNNLAQRELARPDDRD
jgi:hypothetical protein